MLPLLGTVQIRLSEFQDLREPDGIHWNGYAHRFITSAICEFVEYLNIRAHNERRKGMENFSSNTFAQPILSVTKSSESLTKDDIGLLTPLDCCLILIVVVVVDVGPIRNRHVSYSRKEFDNEQFVASNRSHPYPPHSIPPLVARPSREMSYTNMNVRVSPLDVQGAFDQGYGAFMSNQKGFWQNSNFGYSKF